MVYFPPIYPYISGFPKAQCRDTRHTANSIYVWKVSRVGLEPACCRPWPTYGLLVFPLCCTAFLNPNAYSSWQVGRVNRVRWVGKGRNSCILPSFITRVMDPDPNPIWSETINQVGSGILLPDPAPDLDPRQSGLTEEIKICIRFANLNLFKMVYSNSSVISYDISLKSLKIPLSILKICQLITWSSLGRIRIQIRNDRPWMQDSDPDKIITDGYGF